MANEKSEIYASLVRFVREFGRYPSKQECKNIDWLFGWNTYWRRLGHRSNLTILQDVYTENPNKCQQCLSPLTFEKRTNKFCCQSCAAKSSNANRARTRVTNALCRNCGGTLTRYQGLYCSQSCHREYEFKIRLQNWLDAGLHHDNLTIRKFLTATKGYNCSCCGLSDWNGSHIVLEVDHINGDSEDCSPSNVRLICPNCHSQTDTYKGKNAGRGRHKRSQRYRDGKSY